MTELDKICNLEFIEKVLQENIDVDKLIEQLVLKAHEAAPTVESLEKLEGKSIKKGNIVLLKHCPMIKIIQTIKEKNFKKTGKKDFPAFYKKIIQKYTEKYPDDAAILHPFCIVHQAIREIICASKNILARQIACRDSSGKVATSKKGLKLASLTEDEVKDMIKEYACAYFTKRFSGKDNG